MKRPVTPAGETRLTVLRTIGELRRKLSEFRSVGRTIGLIPTMGALHQGHLSLVRGAIERDDVPVTSIFVNPTQFGPGEDFAAYPRDESGDLRKLEEAGCRVVFAPDKDEMYPDPQLTTVTVSSLTTGLCGPLRPGHFQGVATVVCKLLMVALPNRAYFGEKDYQQLQVIKRMAKDLAMPIEILGMPTVREPDGLAMSSRNVYLTASERTTAGLLYRELTRVAEAVRDGRSSCATVASAAGDRLLASGFGKIEYLSVVDAQSLHPIDYVTTPARVVAAVRLGRTRLIDNVAVN